MALIIGLLLSNYYTFSKKEYNKDICEIVFWLLCLALILVSGIRYGVGADYYGYKYVYYSVSKADYYNEHFEILYILLMNLLALFKLKYGWILIIISTMIIVPISKTIWDYSKYPFLSLSLFVYLYFYFASFNVTRQYLAAAILFFGLRYIFDRSFIKYLICVIIAGLFHTVAFIGIILYFLYYINISNKLTFIILGISLLFAIFGNDLIEYMISLVPKYSIYANYGKGSAFTDLAVQLSTVALFMIAKSNVDLEKGTFRFLYNSNLLATILSFATYGNVLFARIGVFFYIFSIISIPYAISYTKKKKVFIALFILLGLFVCVRYLIYNNCGVVPFNIENNWW